MNDEDEAVDLSGTRTALEGADGPRGDSDQQAVDQEPQMISAPSLAGIFLLIGGTSVGGVGPSLAIIERELVDRRSILTAEDVTEAAAATRLLPGSSLVQLASFLGYRIGGWKGSLIATVACILPPAAAMLLMAACSEGWASNPTLGRTARGVTPAVIGLLLASMCRLGRSAIGGPLALGIGLTAWGAAALLGVPAAAVVIVAGLIGILLFPASGAWKEPSSRRGGRW